MTPVHPSDFRKSLKGLYLKVSLPQDRLRADSSIENAQRGSYSLGPRPASCEHFTFLCMKAVR